MNNDKDQKQDNKHGIDFIAESRDAVKDKSPFMIRATLFLLIFVFAAGLIWAYFSKLEITTVGEGRIISSSHLQVVQNLEGGIVKKINVKEGQSVKKGQVLIQLNETQFDSAYGKDLAKFVTLQAAIARLTAEVSGADSVNFPTELKEKYPRIAADETQLFNTRKQELNHTLESLQREYTLTNDELKAITPLVKQRIISIIEKIRLEKELNRINREQRNAKNKFLSNAHDELNDTKGEIIMLEEILPATKDRLHRTAVRSPIDGIVHNIYITTVGEVVTPGMKIMEIAPIDKSSYVEVKIAPSDIGFIHVGQTASVKINAYDYSVYGSLDAEVINISPDTVTNEKGETFYEVKLKSDKNYVGPTKKPLVVIPGMTVTASILTDEKSVLNYILKPFLKTTDMALHER